MTLSIRLATDADWPAILGMLMPVFAAGETYAVDRDLDDEAIRGFWMMPAHEVFVAELDGAVIGTSWVHPKHQCRHPWAHHQKGGGAGDLPEERRILRTKDDEWRSYRDDS